MLVRRFRHLAAVAVFMLPPAAALAQAPVPPFRADTQTAWTQFRGGGGLNPVVVNPNLPAEPSWRFEGPDKGTSTSPVIAGKLVLIAANDHNFYALDASNGTLAWRWKGDNEIMSAPVYKDGIAAIGTGDADSPVWNPPDYNLVGMGKSDLNGIDLRTGKKVWTFALTGSGMPMPALVGNTLLHVDGSGVFLALDIRNGNYLWRKLFFSNGSMTNVLVGTNGLAYWDGRFPNAVYALSASDGRTVWTHGFPKRDGAFDDCPLATDGSRIFGMYAVPVDPDPKKIVLANVRAQQHVYALDARTGGSLWDRTLDVTGVEPGYNEASIPMVSGGMLFEGSPFAPVVTALDTRSGRVVWSASVTGPVKSGFVERDGIVYFGDFNGRLWALAAATGKPVGSVQTDVRFNVGSPVILNDSLVIGSQQGPVLAVPLAAIRDSRALAGVTTGNGAMRGGMVVVALLLAVAACAILLLLGWRRRARHLPH